MSMSRCDEAKFKSMTSYIHISYAAPVCITLLSLALHGLIAAAHCSQNINVIPTSTQELGYKRETTSSMDVDTRRRSANVTPAAQERRIAA